MNSSKKMNSSQEGIGNIMSSLIRRVYNVIIGKRHLMDTDIAGVFPVKRTIPAHGEWDHFTRVMVPVRRPPQK